MAKYRDKVACLRRKKQLQEEQLFRSSLLQQVHNPTTKIFLVAVCKRLCVYVCAQVLVHKQTAGLIGLGSYEASLIESKKPTVTDKMVLEGAELEAIDTDLRDEMALDDEFAVKVAMDDDENRLHCDEELDEEEAIVSDTESSGSESSFSSPSRREDKGHNNNGNGKHKSKKNKNKNSKNSKSKKKKKSKNNKKKRSPPSDSLGEYVILTQTLLILT